MPPKKSRAIAALKVSVTPNGSSMDLGDVLSRQHGLYHLNAPENKSLFLDSNVVITGVDLG